MSCFSEPQFCGVHNPADTFPRECGFPQAIIQSPRYPSHYPANTNLDWNIEVAKGRYIKLRFLDFDIPTPSESDWPCRFAFLKLWEEFKERNEYDNAPPEYFYQTLCNGEYQEIIQSRFNKVRLIFEAQRRGGSFKAEYTAMEFKGEAQSESPRGKKPYFITKIKKY